MNIFPGLESCVEMNWPEHIREECEARWMPTRSWVVNNKVDFIKTYVHFQTFCEVNGPRPIVCKQEYQVQDIFMYLN